MMNLVSLEVLYLEHKLRIREAEMARLYAQVRKASNSRSLLKSVWMLLSRM